MEIDELLKSNFDKNKVDDLLDKLKKDENAFKHLALDLKEKDPEQFEEFRKSVIEIDESFRPIFDNIWFGEASKELALWVNNIKWVNIWNSVLEKQTDDGFNIEAWKKRKLSMEGSDYQLESKLETKKDILDVMEIEKNTKGKLTPFNEKLNTIHSLKNYVKEAIVKEAIVKEAIVKEVDVDKVKQVIKQNNPELYNELKLDLTTSLEQIIQGLDYMYNKIEKEKDKILKWARERINEIVEQNTNEAKEKDEKKKETLIKLHETCFDIFPQEITNQLIKEYKTTAMVIPLPWWRPLNKETMDLENARFWEPLTAKAWWDMMIDNLVMFIEKAIYGKIWSENSIFKNKNFKTWATIDSTDFIAAAKENWVLSKGGWNINALKNNLKKEIKTEDVENEEVKKKKVEWSDWYSE